MSDRSMDFRTGGTILRPVSGDTMVVASDQHYAPPKCPSGGIDPGAESCFLQALGLIKPSIYTNIGDVGEWNAASHWQWKRRKRPAWEFQRDSVRADAKGNSPTLGKAPPNVSCPRTREAGTSKDAPGSKIKIR